MPTIPISNKHPGVSGDIPIPNWAGLEFRGRDIRRVPGEDGYVASFGPISVKMVDGRGTLDLHESWVGMACEVTSVGWDGPRFWFLVPAVDTLFHELTPVDPESLDPVAEPVAAWDLRVSRLEQLVDGKADAVELVAADFGVSAHSTGAENRSRLQAAVDAAMSAGLPLRLPYESFDVAGTVIVGGAGGIRIYGDRERTVMHLADKPKSLFRITAPNVDIGSFTITGDGLDMTGHPYEHYQWYVGVHLGAGSDGSTARHITSRDVYVPVRIDLRTQMTTPDTFPAGGTKNLTVDDIYATGSWVVVDIGSADNFTISNIRGDYRFATATDGTDVGQNPHLVYLHRSYAGRRNVGGLIRDCEAIGGDPKSGAAYALKYTDGLNAYGLSATDCPGILDIIGLADSTVTGAVSVQDRYGIAGVAVPGETSRASVAILDSDRVKVQAAVSFAPGAHTAGGITEATARDCELDIRVVARHTTLDNPALADVQVKGMRNRVRADVRNLGTVTWATAILANTTGADCVIDSPRVGPGYTRGVYVINQVGTRITYLPEDVAAPAKIVAAASLRTRVIRLDTPAFIEDLCARADATYLVAATDGQVPAVWDNATSAAGTVGVLGGRAVVRTATAYATADTGKANGQIAATFHGSSAVTGSFLVGRFADQSNFIYATPGMTGAPGVWVLAKRVGGTASVVAASTVVPADGDDVLIDFTGTTVTLWVNGTVAATATVTDHAAASRFGLGGAAVTNTWGRIRITPR